MFDLIPDLSRLSGLDLLILVLDGNRSPKEHRPSLRNTAPDGDGDC